MKAVDLPARTVSKISLPIIMTIQFMNAAIN